jgi:hypothetical protein
MKRLFQFSFIALALAFYVLCPPPTKGQTNFTGEWKADTKSEKSEKIYLSFEHRTTNGKNQQGSSYEYNDLQGLSREQADGSGSVNFQLVREAGTIACEGKFENGKGVGTFRFTANQSFISAMKSRGYDFNDGKYGETEDRLFAATTLNLTTAFADDLNTANFGSLTIDDLFKARIFNITSQFMREMKATGFPDLGMEDLVKARIFKIDADYIRQLSEAGLKNEPFESLVKARIFKIDANLVKQVRALGFKDQSIESLVKMSIFKITPEFISEVKNEGFNNLSIEELVKMKIFKIDGAFIRQAKAKKANVDVEEMVQMKIGVWSR